MSFFAFFFFSLVGFLSFLAFFLFPSRLFFSRCFSFLVIWPCWRGDSSLIAYNDGGEAKDGFIVSGVRGVGSICIIGLQSYDSLASSLLHEKLDYIEWVA